MTTVLRNPALQKVLDRSPTSKLGAEDTKALTDILKSEGPEALAADLRELLQKDSFAPSGLAALKAIVLPPASPAPTLSIPAAIGSTLSSEQTTGPTGRVITDLARTLIQMWALPGATVRVYNASSLNKDGNPTLIKEVTAPLEPDGAAVQCLPGALPTQQEFAADAARFQAAPHDGMVLVSIPLSPSDDQDSYDTFQLTQQSASRPESTPLPVTLHSYSAPMRRNREVTLDPAKLSYADGVISTRADFAVAAGTVFHVRVNNQETALSGQADGRGRITLDLRSLPSLNGLTISLTANGGSPTELDLKALGISASPPPDLKQIADWDQKVLKGLLAPVGNKVGFQLDHLPDGVEVQVRNANAPSQVQTFRSAGGRLDVSLSDVLPGDSVSLRINAPLSFSVEQPGTSEMRRLDFTVDGTYTIGSKQEQDQMAALLDTFKGYPRADLQSVLHLFGPHSQVVGAPLDQPEKLKTVFDAARLASILPDNWVQPVRQHLVQSGTPVMLEGFDLGRAYLKAKGEALTGSLQDVGITFTGQDPSRQVITGGYSPISGDHGPLQPEFLSGASHYRLDALGLPPLALQTSPQRPSGWVNPAAVGLTFGLTSGQANSASFSYDFPQR